MDDWNWTVQYHDGTRIAETDVAGWQSLKLDQIQLITFFQFHVVVPVGAEPVFFRRFRSTVRFDTNEQIRQLVAVCLGWKSPDQQSLMWLHADGLIILADRDIDEVTLMEQ